MNLRARIAHLERRMPEPPSALDERALLALDRVSRDPQALRLCQRLQLANWDQPYEERVRRAWADPEFQAVAARLDAEQAAREIA